MRLNPGQACRVGRVPNRDESRLGSPLVPPIPSATIPSMTRARIDIPNEKIAEFCRRNRIKRLALFGSVLRDDFRPDSDVDVLVEFEPDARVGLLTLVGMEIELTDLLGHKVDLNTPGFLSDYFRDAVLAEAEVRYDVVASGEIGQPRGTPRDAAGTSGGQEPASAVGCAPHTDPFCSAECLSPEMLHSRRIIPNSRCEPMKKRWISLQWGRQIAPI